MRVRVCQTGALLVRENLQAEPGRRRRDADETRPMGAAGRHGLGASDSHGADHDVDIEWRHDEHIVDVDLDVNVVDIDNSRRRRPLFVHWRLPAK